MSKETEDMFNRVVANAVDFLEHSLAELEKAPKYSIIHFCSAIELFLKAKLMLEHWSLIDEEPKRANISRFRDGSSRSVSIDETIERLENISNVKIPKEGRRSFSDIREHRNKMVHFYHPDYADEVKNTIQSIVIEQNRAWFYLHRLLTKDWRSDFKAYQDKIADLHRLVENNRAYLQAKFDALRLSIQKGYERGVVFSRCRSCNFPAAKEKTVLGNLDVLECVVCEFTVDRLRETCPQCKEELFVYDLGERFCENCDETIGLNDFLDKYAPITHIEKDIFEENRAYCSYCEFTDEASVVPFYNKWLCLCCLQLHSQVNPCGWCATLIAGDTEDSYAYGCKVWCQGYLGYHSDD